MSNATLERLQRTAEAVDSELRAHGDNAGDSCILGVRILMHLLREDFEVRALPCRVAAWNHIWIEHIRRYGAAPETREEVADLTARGGWAVGIGSGFLDWPNAPFGYHPDRQRYNGHLTLVADRRYLIDPTLGQATDPEHNIHLGPVAYRISNRAFIHGSAYLADLFAWPPHDAVHVTYMAVPGDRTYRDTPDWRNGLGEHFAERVRLRLSHAAA